MVYKKGGIFMRTYRLEIRLIQAAVGLALVVLIAGFFGLWGRSGNISVGGAGTGATTSTSNQAQVPSNPKIVALGDSFTWGYPFTQKDSWTQRLQQDLHVTVINKGKGSQTTKDLLSRFDADVLAEKPGRVIIFAGIGDGITNVPLKDVQANIQAMVDKAKANHIIPVLALPIWYPGANQNIQEIRVWEISYAQKSSILTLDFASVLFDSNDKYLSGLSSDNGKYPSIKGYQVMGDYAAGVLK